MSRSRLPLYDAPAVPSWVSGESPDTRLRLFTGITLLPLLAIALRLGSLPPPESSQDARAARIVLEPIPARDGRILSSDGHVLAEDVEAFSLLVHYRWLERPADPLWLRGEALRGLTPRQRRDPATVAAAEAALLERRQELWSALSELSGLPPEDLSARFAAIQERVSAIRRAVERNREQELTRHDVPDAPPTLWWQVAWDAVATAVTTPPQPRVAEPLVLAEELAHHKVADGLSVAAAAAVEGDPDRFPGTRVRVASRRRYPAGATAPHLIGYRFPAAASGDETAQTRGETGIERACDRHLRGIDGLRKTWLDRQGDVFRSETLRAPRVGRDVILHLDLALQKHVERVLDEALAAARSSPDPPPDSAGGAAVLLDVRSGAILAAASAPRFDLARAAARDRRLWDVVLTDPAAPLFDRVCRAAVPPGSVFKPVSAAALLASGRIDPDDPFECLGYLDRPERHRDFLFRHSGIGHGPTTLASALAESCNVYFFHGARVIGGRPLVDWARRFGFGQPTGIDLPAESSGHLADGSDPLGLAIGQSDLTATPLQIARFIAAIANGGRLVTPHVVRGSGPPRPGADPLRPSPGPDFRIDLPAAQLDRIREGLERAIAHPRGTGYKTVRHADVAIAGKTGTAEVGNGKPDHAWFAGYLPADEPRFAVVVLLEHAGSGGQAAGPLAHAIADALFNRGFLQR